MGHRAITWAYMESYIRAYQALLRGEVVEWEGAQMQMLHPGGHAQQLELARGRRQMRRSRIRRRRRA